MIRIALLAGLASTVALGAEREDFVPLFNGRDLTGWVNVNCAPETWTVREGLLHCTGIPTGALRTTRQYENFVLELEWRHLRSGGNSGVFLWATAIAAPGVPFLRGIEVQVLDHGYDSSGKNQWYTTHGDVFPIHGATMKPLGRHRGMRSFPSEERSKPSPEWNHYRIVCTNGVIRLSVNGAEVSGGEDCDYRKGYLALESEGAPIDFRNIRIQELPGSGAAERSSAPPDLGWRALFTGIDLRGWTTRSGEASRWEVRGERLALKDGDPNLDATLWTEHALGDVELIVDCRPAKGADDQEPPRPSLRLRGDGGRAFELPLTGAEAGKFQRFTVKLQGRNGTLSLQDRQVEPFTLPDDLPARGKLGLSATAGNVEFMNLYVRDL